MKLKFKLMTIFAILGVAATAYAAWHFVQPTDGEVDIKVDIETQQSIGVIELDHIGEYNLDQDPHPLVFTARYLEGSSGVSIDDVLLTYEVVLNEELGQSIDFGRSAHGVLVNDVETSITHIDSNAFISMIYLVQSICRQVLSRLVIMLLLTVKA